MEHVRHGVAGTGERALERFANFADWWDRPADRRDESWRPPWLTRDWVRGGAHTFVWAAGGALQAQEIAKLDQLGLTPDAGRRPLNEYFRGARGRREMMQLLAAGRLSCSEPEGVAWLVHAWLLDRGETARAKRLAKRLQPYASQHRFYPWQVEYGKADPVGVSLRTAGEVVTTLRRQRTRQPSRNEEAVRIWAPLYDELVSLFCATVEGPVPVLTTNASGHHIKSAAGHAIIEGGWPCRRYPPGWIAAARDLLARYAQQRSRHRLCGKPERPKENFARLRAYLSRCIEDPASLSGRDVGMIRKILASYVARYGTPGGQEVRALRERQLEAVGYAVGVAAIVAQRLAGGDPASGVADVEKHLEPLDGAEAEQVGLLAGTEIPKSIAHKVMRCLEAPLRELAEKGVLKSAGQAAPLIADLYAELEALQIDDVQLRSLYLIAYRGYRPRRSAYLLGWGHTIPMRQLPWLAAVEPWLGSQANRREPARQLLATCVREIIELFPYATLPNRVVWEYRLIDADAQLGLSLVMKKRGSELRRNLSEAHVQQLMIAASALEGSLYARYYEIPYGQIVSECQAAPVSDRADHLFNACRRRVPSRSVPVEDTEQRLVLEDAVVEQAEIITTHNLALLFAEFDLPRTLQRGVSCLAQDCLRQVSRQLTRGARDEFRRGKLVRKLADSWRQMIFYLSLVPTEEQLEFIAWADDFVAGARGQLWRRIAPALAGLEAIVNGGEFDAKGEHLESGGRRFLGVPVWTPAVTPAIHS